MWGKAPSITSTISFWDGEPGNGGNFFSEIAVPPLVKTNSCHAVVTTWNMSRPGIHTVYGIVDEEQRIVEQDESNNINQLELAVPGFVLQSATDAPAYDPDTPVIITTEIINLHPDFDLRLALTTTISSDWIPYHMPQFHYQDTQVVAAPANGRAFSKVIWISANVRGSRNYRVNITGQADSGSIQQSSAPFQIRDSINFMASPLSGTAPLRVYFEDLSTPIDAARKLEWNFGDGSPSIVAELPSHIYTTPGVYTITLTATNSISYFVKIKPNYIEVFPAP